MSVFDVIPTGRLLQKEEMMLTTRKPRISLRKLEMICNKSSNGLPRLSTQSWTNSGRGFAKSFGCLAGDYRFHISACGDLMPCDFTPTSFGNVRNHSLADLWEKLIIIMPICRHQDNCRMQSSEFRNKYIHSIPPNTPLPVLIEELEDEKSD